MPTNPEVVGIVATKTKPPLTQDSPRPDLVAELDRANVAAKLLKPSPAYDIAHERINQLLDWLVGR